MKHFLKIHRSLLLATLMLLIMGLGGWFGILPLYREIQEKRDGIQKEYASQENKQRQIRQLPELEARYDSILAEEGRLDILLTEAKIVDFIRTVESLARETNTEVKIEANDAPLVAPKKKSQDKLSPEEEEKAKAAEQARPKLLVEMLPFAQSLRLKITLQGEYQNIVQFLAKLETLPVALDVVAIELQPRLKEDEVAGGIPEARPNPFSLVPGSDVIVETETLPTETEEVEVKTDNYQAVFDTVVYVDKGK